MSDVIPFKGKYLTRARDLADRHMGRILRIGNVEGQLVGLVPQRHRVDLDLIVGGSRALFSLDPGAHVEVGPAPTKENPR